MLVLSRNAHDDIIIGDDIEITILAISGNTVKLGITAPADVSIHRSEVYVQVVRDTHDGQPVQPSWVQAR